MYFTPRPLSTCVPLTDSQHPVPLEQQLLELEHGQVLDAVDAVDKVQSAIEEGKASLKGIKYKFFSKDSIEGGMQRLTVQCRGSGPRRQGNERGGEIQTHSYRSIQTHFNHKTSPSITPCVVTTVESALVTRLPPCMAGHACG